MRLQRMRTAFYIHKVLAIPGVPAELCAAINQFMPIVQAYGQGCRVVIKSFKHSKIILQGHTNTVYSVALGTHGTHVISASRDYTARMWDLQSRCCVAHITCDYGLSAMCLADNGAFAATVAFDCNIQLWTTRTLQPLLTLRGHYQVVHAVAACPQSLRVASGSMDKTVRVWHASTGECLYALPVEATIIWCVTFSSADSSCIAAGGTEGCIYVWQHQHNVAVLRHGFTCIYDVSMADQMIATGGSDSMLRIWDLDRGALLQVWEVQGPLLTVLLNRHSVFTSNQLHVLQQLTF